MSLSGTSLLYGSILRLLLQLNVDFNLKDYKYLIFYVFLYVQMIIKFFIKSPKTWQIYLSAVWKILRLKLGYY